MIKYGYIINYVQYEPDDQDVVWDFKRTDQHGETTAYKGIKTKRDIDDPNIHFIGECRQFNQWRTQFEKDDL